MTEKAWQKDASESLKQKMHAADESYINGYDFLLDYVNENLEDFIELSDSEYDDDLAEQFAQNEIDNFQDYLKKECGEWLSIQDSYSWARRNKIEIESKVHVGDLEGEPNEQELTNAETEILNKDTGSIKKDEYLILAEAYQKLLNTEQLEIIAELAVKIASWNEKQDKVTYSDKANYFDIAAEKKIEANIPGGARLHKKAAEICDYKLDFQAATKYYSKAFTQGKKEGISPDELIMIARQCRRSAELFNDGTTASDMFVKEHNEIFLKSKFPYKFGWGFYKLFFNFGESPLRVFLVAFGVIIFFACAYYLVGINSSSNSKVTSASGLSSVHDLSISVYYSVVTFTTLGYGDFSPSDGMARFLSSIEAVLGLLLTSFFLVSIYRKYTR